MFVLIHAFASWLSLVSIDFHVFVPTVLKDFSWLFLLFFVCHCESLLFLQELLILLTVTQTHVICISLSITFRET